MSTPAPSRKKYYQPQAKISCTVCGGTYYQANAQRHINSIKHQNVTNALATLHAISPPAEAVIQPTNPYHPYPPPYIQRQSEPPTPQQQFQRWNAYYQTPTNVSH